MNPNFDFDVIVIGGGAAGLMAAASAAKAGHSTLLLEKNRKLGVKILMSGGTRCNITHHCDTRGIVAAFGRNGNFLHSSLASFSPQDVVDLMNAQGVATKVEETGKVFPVSDRAIDVRDALVRFAEQSSAKIATEQPVRNIQRMDSDAGFTIAGDHESWTTRNVIVTTGGLSYPGCGTTGDGYPWAKKFGHSITPTAPALVPILSRCDWANELKGITIGETAVSVWAPQDNRVHHDEPSDNINISSNRKPKKKNKPKPLAKRAGSFLFTHWGFSGPSVLDVSREVALHQAKNSLQLVCDFLPGLKTTSLTQRLQEKKKSDGKQMIGNLLNEFFPKRFADALMDSSGVLKSLKNAELSNEQLNRIVGQVKQCQFPINGTLGFEKAEVTAGGVDLTEVDSRTMESKLQSGLYFAGEVLDLDGFIGGFNFQSAFSTGWLAGCSIQKEPIQAG